MQKARFLKPIRLPTWAASLARTARVVAEPPAATTCLLRGAPEMATHVIEPRAADLLAGRTPSAPGHRLGELFAKVSGWLAERRHYRATVAELSALSARKSLIAA
jgi:hypothetical protein